MLQQRTGEAMNKGNCNDDKGDKEFSPDLKLGIITFVAVKSEA